MGQLPTPGHLCRVVPALAGWAERWAPPDSSLTLPVREHSLPAPRPSPGEAAPAGAGVSVPKSRPNWVSPAAPLARQEPKQEPGIALPCCTLPAFGTHGLEGPGQLCSQPQLPPRPPRLQSFSSRPRHCSCT